MDLKTFSQPGPHEGQATERKKDGRMPKAKPENILTRSEKLITLGKQEDALKVLHDYSWA